MHPDLEELLHREEETAEAAIEPGAEESMEEAEEAMADVLPQECEACGSAFWSLARVEGKLVFRCRCGAMVEPGDADDDAGADSDAD
jgi:hypothetical protein